MAIFKKNEPQPQKARDRAPAPTRNASGDAAISIIGQGMTVVGDITTEGIVRVEGEVRGTVKAGKAVILGQGGIVDGNVFTEDAVIGGTVSGSIVAGNRLELQSTCTVSGEIRTRAERLKLEEGARFAGQVQIIEEDVADDSAGASQHRGAVGQPAGPSRSDAATGSPKRDDAARGAASPDAATTDARNAENGAKREDDDKEKQRSEAGEPAEAHK
ncbi:MAG: polymer-forming cytoskeletal protein [Gemmatimonadota bacterium]